MGPSRDDPSRQVGIFNPEFASKLQALRAAEMQKFRWLSGRWNSINRVPATTLSPAYVDTGAATFTIHKQDGWIYMGTRDGGQRPHITFDAFSHQWIYLLQEGAYGILRAPGWYGNRIVFTGRMTMIGVDCQWRLTWTKTSDDHFVFVNEEKLPDGSWADIDTWEFERATA